MVVITMGPVELKQRMTALEKANEIRTGRAALRLDVKSGEMDVRDLIDRPPAFIRTMPVGRLLAMIPYWGPMKVNRTLATVGISASKTIGGMTLPQRLQLLRVVDAGLAPRPRYWVDLDA